MWHIDYYPQVQKSLFFSNKIAHIWQLDIFNLTQKYSELQNFYFSIDWFISKKSSEPPIQEDETPIVENPSFSGDQSELNNTAEENPNFEGSVKLQTESQVIEHVPGDPNLKNPNFEDKSVAIDQNIPVKAPVKERLKSLDAFRGLV